MLRRIAELEPHRTKSEQVYAHSIYIYRIYNMSSIFIVYVYIIYIYVYYSSPTRSLTGTVLTLT